MFREMIPCFLEEVSGKQVGYKFRLALVSASVLTFRSQVDERGEVLSDEAFFAGVIRDWYKANCLAVAARYPNREPGTSALMNIEVESRMQIWNPVHREAIDRILLVRHLDCLIYQCGEDVRGSDREWFDSMVEEMKRVRSFMTGSIVRDEKIYQRGPWGESVRESSKPF